MSAGNASVARQRGVTGQTTRRVLAALERPARTPDLVLELGLTHEDVWSALKHLHHVGWATRLQRGVYQISEAGRVALTTPSPVPAKAICVNAKAPPAGTRWTPERTAWLERHYARLGPKRCGDLLGVHWQAVHAKATTLGLRFGEVDGYQLLTDLAALLQREYTTLYTRAKRAHVLTFPGTVVTQERRSKAMVPDWWVDQIVEEIQPPAEDDVALSTLRATLGLSKTQMARRAGRDARLRTPPGHGSKGQQAQLYVSAAVAERITARYRQRRRTPAAPVVGRGGVLGAITAAGAHGTSERELYEALPCSRAAVRLYVRSLVRDGVIERCRPGTTLDPFVYRVAAHQGEAQPAQRTGVIPGRPKAIHVPQAAD